ncbi:uncharacterized protein LOC144119529 [Amblyomma americanum]
MVRVDGPKLLPGRSLVCVLGGRVQEYGVTRLDGLCDVVFVPFYALPKGGDTLLNDGHRITQEVLEAAAKSVTTTYGIHVPLGKVSQVITDLKRKSAQQRMKNYWMKYNIYHYGVLDLHVGKNGTTASDAAGRVFALLKEFRHTQNNIRRESEVASKHHRAAYVVLGVRSLLATNGQLFKTLEEHARSFVVSAFIFRTHISDSEASTPHYGCNVNGPAAYKIKNSKHFMGMADAVSYASKFSWARNTTLAVSFTLCTRRYRPQKALHIGAECSRDAKRKTTTIASSALCSERPDFYANQAIDKIQHTAYSWRKPDVVATYDTADTMRWKICSLEKTHRHLKLSVALFDAECEDWRGMCTLPSTSHMRGSDRMRKLHAFLRQLSRRGKNSSRACP